MSSMGRGAAAHTSMIAISCENVVQVCNGSMIDLYGILANSASRRVPVYIEFLLLYIRGGAIPAHQLL